MKGSVAYEGGGMVAGKWFAEKQHGFVRSLRLRFAELDGLDNVCNYIVGQENLDTVI